MIRLPLILRLAAVLVPLSAAASAASAPTPEEAAEIAAIKQTLSEIKPVRGNVTIGENLARLDLQKDYLYLNAEDSNRVLHDLWKNPADPRVLGMIVPRGFNPLAATSWATVITYEDSGYVKDDDAAKLDYDDLMKKMRDRVAAANEERTKQGYAKVQLIGWAQPPRYDAAQHKLYWAKELDFGDEKEHTLNYNIRILGRKGVLVLNTVAPMDQLGAVDAATPAVLAMVNFNTGNHYADFNSSTDKVATYGLAALIVGGIAAKAGFFKLLLVGILAAKKFIILGIAAFAGFFRKLWAKITSKDKKAESALRAP